MQYLNVSEPSHICSYSNTHYFNSYYNNVSHIDTERGLLLNMARCTRLIPAWQMTIFCNRSYIYSVRWDVIPYLHHNFDGGLDKLQLHLELGWRTISHRKLGDHHLSKQACGRFYMQSMWMYITVYRTPMWKSNGTIFSESNLSLIPRYR